MRVLWGRAALDDLKKRAYIAEHHPAAAHTIALKIVDAARRLEDNPDIGPVLGTGGFRRLVVTGSVYVLIYRVQHDVVSVFEVFDARRRRPRTRV
jgi:plasmid stabilization system protein ParE